jgi:hypothetical protein
VPLFELRHETGTQKVAKTSVRSERQKVGVVEHSHGRDRLQVEAMRPGGDGIAEVVRDKGYSQQSVAHGSRGGGHPPAISPNPIVGDATGRRSERRFRNRPGHREPSMTRALHVPEPSGPRQDDSTARSAVRRTEVGDTLETGRVSRREKSNGYNSLTAGEAGMARFVK